MDKQFFFDFLVTALAYFCIVLVAIRWNEFNDFQKTILVIVGVFVFSFVDALDRLADRKTGETQRKIDLLIVENSKSHSEYINNIYELITKSARGYTALFNSVDSRLEKLEKKETENESSKN